MKIIELSVTVIKSEKSQQTKFKEQNEINMMLNIIKQKIKVKYGQWTQNMAFFEK